MYFNAEAQTRILQRLHFALNAGSFLFLGRSEMLLTHANLFTPRGRSPSWPTWIGWSEWWSIC